MNLGVIGQIISQKFADRPIPLPTGGSFLISVAAEVDDGEIWNDNFYPTGDASDNLGWAGLDQYVFRRFILPQAIPAGATITDARLYNYAANMFGWVDGDTDLYVLATSSSNAAAPTLASDRPVEDGGDTITTAPTTWLDVTWTRWTYITSSDLSPVIQRLVTDFGGLASGAGVVLWTRGDFAVSAWAGGALYGCGSGSAQLRITYTI
jgi:hypothetical protein